MGDYFLTNNTLKNHYITPRKTSINNGKNTYKKRLYNQQYINQL